MAKVKLADVLWRAANEHLKPDECGFGGDSSFTCDCVRYAARYAVNATERFLESIGLPKKAVDRYDLFDAFPSGEERQGVRYMWLLLAMHVAEDEDIEIEATND